ncbi:MAG: hypothetical protein HKN52_07480 [Eudoraea sp.]|nr:hypothetical protein [Eudoraea sp.]
MNKLFLVCGLVLMGITTTSQSENPTTDLNNQVTIENVSLAVNEHTLFWTTDKEEVALANTGYSMPLETSKNLELNQIAYLEAEEVIDLGFDSREYLPANFDPAVFYFDLEAVVYIEEYENTGLDFNTEDYLPNNFNAYEQPEDFMDISYLEEKDDSLGFDTETFLPEGFDAYETELDLNSVVYIEEDYIFNTYYECLDF